MGQTGPAASFAGYGYHAAAIAGFYEVTGWPDLPPDGPWSAYTDVVAPRFFATTILAALDRRRRTGSGEHIDSASSSRRSASSRRSCSTTRSSGRIATRAGNRVRLRAPHAIYPCAGDDQWCAIAVETDEQWQALRQRARRPRLVARRPLRQRHGRGSPRKTRSTRTSASGPRAPAVRGDASAAGGRRARRASRSAAATC